jgi:hypothetical protein
MKRVNFITKFTLDNRRAVKDLFENPAPAGAVQGKRGACHLARFNYEDEFSKIANWIAARAHDTLSA